MNMAIDEAILVAQKEQPNPTLRFYGWTQPAFSFGYFQDITAEVDVDACRADGIELVKRMTGGGTVVHGWELTYTLILPRGTGELGVSEAYQYIGESLVKAFQKLDIPAQCYAECPNTSQAAQNICLTNPAEHDVMSDNKKLAGVSVRRNQKRDNVSRLHLLGYAVCLYPHTRSQKILRFRRCLREKSAAINTDGRSITKDTLIQTICETFNFGIAFHSGKLSPQERAQAETLVETKYATVAWNFG